MLRKIFRGIIALIIVISILLLAAYLYAYFTTYTRHAKSMVIAAPHGPVTVTWDEYDIPHITAKQQDSDAIYALGYVHAMERFWQMDLQRHIVSGRLSELFGAATVQQDKFLRTWGFFRAAQTIYPALDKQTKVMVEAYTLGVNTYLQHGKLSLPFHILRHHAEPWTNTDSLAWGKMMAWSLQMSWQTKIENYLIASHLGEDQIKVLHPPYPANAPTVMNKKTYLTPKKANNNTVYNTQLAANLSKLLIVANTIRQQLGFESAPSKGSNNWVVSGKLTQSGKPILANDLHLALQAPALWYLAELRGPTLHVTGATIPGLPMVIAGHNDHIAWGMTTAYIDAQDLYVEPKNTHFKTIDEVIKVKGGKDIHLKVRISQHGPIISDVSAASRVAPRVALRWPALMPGDTTYNSFYQLNYARNWHDFIEAMRNFVTPSQNFIYADVDGNIGYFLPGKLPIRKGFSGALPIFPNEHHEWQGFIPFKQLPSRFNPPQGFIASANNKIIGNDYPYRLTFRWRVPPYRIERIIDLLQKNIPLTVDKMKTIQSDTVSYLWQDLRPQLIQTQPLDQNNKDALTLLKKWDGNMQRSSVAATVFAYWYRELNQLIPKEILFPEKMGPELYEPLFIKQQLRDNGQYCRHLKDKSCRAFLSRTLQTAIKKLITDRGKNTSNWQWGKIHYAEFQDLGLGKAKPFSWLFNRYISSPGGKYTVNAGIYRTRNFQQMMGASYRQIIDLSNLKNSVYMQTLGQSGNIFSPHYADLLLFWRDNRYLTMDQG